MIRMLAGIEECDVKQEEKREMVRGEEAWKREWRILVVVAASLLTVGVVGVAVSSIDSGIFSLGFM